MTERSSFLVVICCVSITMNNRGDLMETIKNRQCFIHGKKQAKYLLIQPIDEHDLEAMEEEIETINKTTKDYLLVGILVNEWQKELSPWFMPAIFGNQDFTGGADLFYQEVKEVIKEVKVLYAMQDANVIIGGYSLAGLFALYAAYQDEYDGVVGASPSVWFKDFLSYTQAHPIQTQYVYLSLGDKDEKARNKIMASVGDCLRTYQSYLQNETHCVLEMNPGNHFKDTGIRVGKGFSWIIQNLNHA